jgi:hypothetical protein
MNTILVINAVASLLATVGIGGFLVRQNRLHKAIVLQPVYLTMRPTRPLSRD